MESLGSQNYRDIVGGMQCAPEVASILRFGSSIAAMPPADGGLYLKFALTRWYSRTEALVQNLDLSNPRRHSVVIDAKKVNLVGPRNLIGFQDCFANSFVHRLRKPGTAVLGPRARAPKSSGIPTGSASASSRSTVLCLISNNQPATFRLNFGGARCPRKQRKHRSCEGFQCKSHDVCLNLVQRNTTIAVWSSCIESTDPDFSGSMYIDQRRST